jgi:4-alpha-glucanotransferase
VSSAELRLRARAQGIATSWSAGGRRHRVRDATLTAVLEALGDQPAAQPHPGGPGGEPRSAVAPLPRRRGWGFTLQLYALRSRACWGHGDLRDLADVASWSARELGAAFVLINPLHAAEPVPPITPSPYTPMSRSFLSPLYLRIEDIPEFDLLNSSERTRISTLAAPLRAANGTAALIDRDAVWSAKRAALEALYRVPLAADRQRDLDAFRTGQGRVLNDWATWCAIAEIHGHDYRAWPARLRDPRSAEVAAVRAERSDAVAFHVWAQWLVTTQAAAAQRAALDAGMDIGIVHDLAVGAFPGGFDSWAGQDTLVSGLTVGAPPDQFNQLGQDWALPAWHPRHLAEQGYRPLADLFGAVARHAGGMRVDHVMGLSRLWVIPPGMSPDRGAYLRYDRDATVGVLASCAADAGVIAVGEDLGTVERGLRGFLARRNILGTDMLWFERLPDGTPLPPALWRRSCLATVSTHDMPPAASFLSGDYVAERARLGLLTRPESAERAEASSATDMWLAALAREGLLPGGARPDAATFTAALYGYLAKTPALLIGVSLADAVGDPQAQNIPGTTDEYPNWRVPLRDGTGAPLLLEDLPASASLREVIRHLDKTGGRKIGAGTRRAGKAVR